MTDELITRTETWLAGCPRKVTDDDFAFNSDLLEAATRYATCYDGTFGFMVDMRSKAVQGELSVPQARGVLNYWRADTRRHKRQPPRQTLPRIREVFDKAKLKYPRLRLAPNLVLSTNNKGQINITDGRPYGHNIWYGRIEPEGGLFESRNMAPEVRDALICFDADPAYSAKVYGQEYSHCCFCGLELTDGRSVSAGYGPICADNWGLPWG